MANESKKVNIHALSAEEREVYYALRWGQFIEDLLAPYPKGSEERRRIHQKTTGAYTQAGC